MKAPTGTRCPVIAAGPDPLIPTRGRLRPGLPRWTTSLTRRARRPTFFDHWIWHTGPAFQQRGGQLPGPIGHLRCHFTVPRSGVTFQFSCHSRVTFQVWCHSGTCPGQRGRGHVCAGQRRSCRDNGRCHGLPSSCSWFTAIIVGGITRGCSGQPSNRDHVPYESREPMFREGWLRARRGHDDRTRPHTRLRFRVGRGLSASAPEVRWPVAHRRRSALASGARLCGGWRPGG
ncbi:hypothetical protein MLGJGCBP_01132 [Rhodococcus sp. T7]|nr:hypothetical protein MLGJGCBP_10125 [Rhodococcus sp. T7]KAF0965706.1 hypothetical protein MLGJGCBP_01132 [Rhodococcus sp. T7]